MSTLAKIIVSILVSMMLLSCNFNTNFGFGVDGNGDVITEERSVNEDFNKIEVSRGLDVYLSQSEDVSISIEADSNLHDIIMTEVENNILKIYANENIRRSTAQKIYVNFKDISSISATSGSDIYGQSEIKANTLRLSTTSGADMDLMVNTNKLYCSSTSGSDMQLSGITEYLSADATSGSDIKAQKLKANTCKANATSGADIEVYTSQELIAKATSGGDIRFSGNPKKIDKSDGPSGSVSKQ